MSLKRKAASTFAAAIVAVSSLMVCTTNANAAVCGFTGIAEGFSVSESTGNWPSGTYENCKDHNVKVRVNYHYASEERCLTPGSTHLTANPNLGALRGVDEIGVC